MHSHHRIDPVSGTAWAAHAAGDSRDARTVTPGRRRSQHQPAFTDRSRPPLLALGAVPSHADMGLSVLLPGEPDALVEAPCRHVYPEHAKLDGHTTFGRFPLKWAHESGTDSAALKRRQQRNVAQVDPLGLVLNLQVTRDLVIRLHHPSASRGHLFQKIAALPAFVPTLGPRDVGQEHGPVNLEQLEQITARRSSKFHPALLRQRAGVHWTMDGTLTLVDADAPTPSASGIGTAVISVFDRLACIQRELIEKAHRL